MYQTVRFIRAPWGFEQWFYVIAIVLILSGVPGELLSGDWLDMLNSLGATAGWLVALSVWRRGVVVTITSDEPFDIFEIEAR